MPMKKQKVQIEQTRTVHMYAELWHASGCLLEQGIKDKAGSSWQFLSSIVLTAFAFEAYLNHAGSTLFPRWEVDEFPKVSEKFDQICKELKVEFPGGSGARPLQTIKKLENFRNTLAHGKTESLTHSCVKNIKLADDHLKPLQQDWQRLIEKDDFAKRAREDVKEVLTTIHDARPDPKEFLFSLGMGSRSTTLIDDKRG